MTITSQAVEAFAVVASVVMQVFILIEMREASAQMREASSLSRKNLELMLSSSAISMKGLELASCPVLTLRMDEDGKYRIHNCGKGPALMAQWGYGKSIADSKAQQRLPDNIIPADVSRPIALDIKTAHVSGVLLFAYSVTNDKYITTVRWVDGDMMIVNFEHYTGPMPKEPPPPN